MISRERLEEIERTNPLLGNEPSIGITAGELRDFVRGYREAAALRRELEAAREVVEEARNYRAAIKAMLVARLHGRAEQAAAFRTADLAANSFDSSLDAYDAARAGAATTP